MATLSWVPRIRVSKTVPATPVITAGAYTSGLQLGGIMQLTDVIRQDSNAAAGFATLTDITVLDSDKQNSAIDIWFFSVSPTVTSVDHGAFAMTAANMKAQCIGIVSLASTIYSSAAAVSVGTMAGINKALQVAGTSATPTSVS